MATQTALLAKSYAFPRQQETGVFTIVSTYEMSATAQNDVIQMAKVQAGTTVLDGYICYDALGASTTIDVGDGDNDDRWISAVDTSSAGFTRFGEAGGTAFPVKYSSDDTVDLTLEGGAGTGTITLVLYCTRETVDLTGS
jgi:hypothetical protein